MAKEGKKPIGKIILIVIVVLIVIGAAGSLGGNSSDSSTDDAKRAPEAAEQTVQEEQEPYTVTDETPDTSNQFTYKITGTLTNNTDQEKSYIQVDYVLYDAEGNQVGTAFANTNHLKAGGTWKFEAVGTASPDEVASWERSDVSGF